MWDIQVDYNEYLKSYSWKAIKKTKLEENPDCEICWEPSITVHHLSYDRLWKESEDDIVSICESCHNDCHFIEWYQIKNNEDDLRRRFEDLKKTKSKKNQYEKNSYIKPVINDKKSDLLNNIEYNKYAFSSASEELKNDKEILMKELNYRGDSLYYSNELLRDDKEVVLIAVKNNWNAIQYASKRLQNDKDVVLEAVKCKWIDLYHALLYTSVELRDDKDIALEAVKNRCYYLEYVSERLKDDKDVVLEAIKKPMLVLDMEREIEKLTNTLEERHSLWYAFYDKFWFNIVFDSALKYASDRLKDDKDIVIEAVKNDWNAIEYASDRLKDDEDVVIEAIKNDWNAIKYSSERLKNNKKIVLDAIANHLDTLDCIPIELKNEKKFKLEIIEILNNSKYFKHLVDKI